MTAPHKPVLPHRRFQGKTQLGPYGDFVAQVDATVGAVMKTLDECQVTDRTIVIYTSDNGSFMTRLDDTAAADHVSDATIQAYRADRHRANHVFRGTKADIWEAGHRVPFFVRWPKTVQPGSRCDQTICLTDVFATLADVIDETPSDEAARDSFSLLPALHREREHVVRAPVIHHSAAGMFAIRDGNWKLVLGDGSGGRENPRGQPFRKPYALFDMNNDISEHDNLIDQHPDIAARLEAVLTHIRESGASK